MENINLCKILKGHEGETFWSDAFGLITLVEIHKDFISCRWTNIETLNFYSNGSRIEGERCIIFPSKNQRDWNKWDKENNHKVPKTWSDTRFNSSFTVYELSYINNDKDCVLTSTGISPIERSALALLKIHQLIEVGYGGNISSEEWNNNEWKFTYQYTKTGIDIISSRISKYIIAFHTKEQAKEFLSYPENVQLLKDYFMIY